MGMMEYMSQNGIQMQNAALTFASHILLALCQLHCEYTPHDKPRTISNQGKPEMQQECAACYGSLLLIKC